MSKAQSQSKEKKKQHISYPAKAYVREITQRRVAWQKAGGGGDGVAWRK